MIPTEEMIKEGEDFNSALFNASVEQCMGGLGGCKHFEITSYPASWRDLIILYVDHEKGSIELTYLAMERYNYRR